MRHTLQPFLALAVLIGSVTGCSRSTPTIPETSTAPAPVSSSEQHPLPDAVSEAKRETQHAGIPKPVNALPVPAGWSRSKPRPLPPADHGFSVAYNHESGLAVTFYQFTRGLTSIPEDVNDPLVREEMLHAKNGIRQATELGYWETAEEKVSKTVTLGDSHQQALWSQYVITKDGMTLASDIYVWSRANTIFKLRSTSRTDGVASNLAVLKPLLTALGTPAPPPSE